MVVTSGDERRWKVGELAQATGLTVRTLHHYDRLGLLVPSDRTVGGHRLYSEGDVERLYRVRTLRHVGLPLSEISSVLDGDTPDLVSTVRRQLARLERDLEHGHRLRGRLSELLSSLERSIKPAIGQFIDVLEAMAVIEADIDVVMRVPYESTDDESGRPRLKRRYPGRKVVLLNEREGPRFLPIWIGAEAGYALVLGLCGQDPQLPLSNDLAVGLLEIAGQRVERVMIERGRANTFVATLVVSTGDDSHELDARPSDALNLAARTGGPVFVNADLMDEHGVSTANELEPRLMKDLAAIPGSDAELPGEWRSLTTDLMSSLGLR